MEPASQKLNQTEGIIVNMNKMNLKKKLKNDAIPKKYTDEQIRNLYYKYQSQDKGLKNFCKEKSFRTAGKNRLKDT